MADRPLEGYSKEAVLRDSDTGVDVRTGDSTFRAQRVVQAAGNRLRQPDGTYNYELGDREESPLVQNREIIYQLKGLRADVRALTQAVLSLHAAGYADDDEMIESEIE